MHGVTPYPVSVIGILPLPESGGKDKKMTDMMNCMDKLREKKIAQGHKPDDHEEQWPQMTM